MMMINQLNQEAFDLASKEMAYLKIFDYIFADFVTREDMGDLLTPQNMVVQVTVPPAGGVGIGGVMNAIQDPSLGGTARALLLKSQVLLKRQLNQLTPDKFLG